MDTLLTSSADLLDDMLAAELPPNWRAELYAGLGEEWREDTDYSWLVPDGD